MDVTKIYNNIQEKIALDNFKTERVHKKKNKKRVLISLSTIAIIFTCLITKNTLKEKKDQIL